MVNPAAILKSAQKQLKEGLQHAREVLSMGGSTFSSSSSLVGAEEDTPSSRGKKPAGKWTLQQSRSDDYARKGSLSSFGSTSSTETTSGNGGMSSGRLFPIPQKRAITESTRAISMESDGSESAALDSKFAASTESTDESPSKGDSSVALEKRASNGGSDSEEHNKRTKTKQQDPCTIQ